ncbi:MAG: polyprenyl synthetase family protein [Planctomycetota bacterium]
MKIASLDAMRRLRNSWSLSEDHLPLLEPRLRAACSSEGTLGDASRYHLSTGGKRLRGRISMAVGLALGLQPEQFLPAATAVELLHGASLVHDDLQDGDQRRRGCEAVWSRFGRDVALLLGDSWIASSFCEATRASGADAAGIVAAITRSIHGLAGGQCVDTQPPSPKDWTPAAYEEMARHKTGKLFALAGEMPMLMAGHSQEQQAVLAEALEWLGVAYQIFDDIADVVGAKGRERASDLRSWKMSSVLVHYLNLRGSAVVSNSENGATSLPLTDSTIERRVDDVLESKALSAALLQQRDALRRASLHAADLPGGVAQMISSLGEEIERRSFGITFELTNSEDTIQPSRRQVTPTPARLHELCHRSA